MTRIYWDCKSLIPVNKRGRVRGRKSGWTDRQYTSSGRTSYIICRTQCRIKIPEPWFKNYQEFQDGIRRALKPNVEPFRAQGPVWQHSCMPTHEAGPCIGGRVRRPQGVVLPGKLFNQSVSHLHFRDMPRQWESFLCQVATTSISDSSGRLGVVNGFGSITEMSTTWIITDSDGSGSPSLYDSLHEHGLYSQHAWHLMQALSPTGYCVTLVKLLDLSVLQFPHL